MNPTELRHLVRKGLRPYHGTGYGEITSVMPLSPVRGQPVELRVTAPDPSGNPRLYSITVREITPPDPGTILDPQGIRELPHSSIAEEEECEDRRPRATDPQTIDDLPAPCKNCGRPWHKRHKCATDPQDARLSFALRLLEQAETALNDETSTLQWRIREALLYMRGAPNPNLATLAHVRRYLTGEYDNQTRETLEVDDA